MKNICDGLVLLPVSNVFIKRLSYDEALQKIHVLGIYTYSVPGAPGVQYGFNHLLPDKNRVALPADER
jgi:hypothetical protein